MEEQSRTNQTNRQLHIYHGILGLIIAGIIIFLSPLGSVLGLYGTGVNELLLFACAILIAKTAGADLKKVFPLQTPTFRQTAGTVILWIASMILMTVATLIMTVLFPAEVGEVSSGLMSAFLSVPLEMRILIIVVLPAICEEMIFRGLFLHSLLRPEIMRRRKWIPIIISGLIFGVFHGNPVRMVPTAFLGIMMAYLVLETDNMFYNMLFHGINNGISILSTIAVGAIPQESDTLQTTEITATGSEYALFSVGIYLCFAAVVPFLMYLGRYLIHCKAGEERKKLFPKGKPWIPLMLLGISALLFVAGMVVMISAVGNMI